MGGWIRHLEPGGKQRQRGETGARRVPRLRGKSAILRLELIHLARFGHEQQSERDQEVAVAFFAASVRHKLFQQQARGARQRHHDAFDIENLSRTKKG